MLDAVSVPVVAAGGIATTRGVAAALAAGAEAARVGTRFIAAEESDAHPAWKQAILEARPEDAVVSTAFNAGMPVPGPHRVLRRSIDAAEALDDEQAGIVRLAGAEIPVARAIEAMPFYAGQSAGAVRAVQPAAEIVQELATGVPQAT